MERYRRKLMENNEPQPVGKPSNTPSTQRTSAPIHWQATNTAIEQTPIPISPSLPDTPAAQPSVPLQPSHADTSLLLSSDCPKPTVSITTKDWTLSALLERGPRFDQVPRVSALSKYWRGLAEDHERRGIPLIVEDWHKLPGWHEGFNFAWLVRNHGEEIVSVRNVHTRQDQDMSLHQFVQECRELSPYASESETRRLYAKDADCPHEWRHWLMNSNVIPSNLLPSGCNDLLAYLPHPETVETLMCYYGVGDTFTPCHKDLCGSSGQNLMCHTDKGSSFWFMTASDAAPDVARYFQDDLEQELDWENHVTTISEFARAPFRVYVAEQKLGDLVLVPPRSCHQVVNHGGLTMKMSWSRMTIKGLQTALSYELPIYRRVCRPEIYRVKSILHYSLRHYTHALKTSLRSYGVGTLVDDQTRYAAALGLLLPMFDEVLRENHRSQPLRSDYYLTGGGPSVSIDRPRMEPSSLRKGKEKEQMPRLVCDCCGADIFQTCFQCNTCSAPDTVLICSYCYVEGRSCVCEEMVPTELGDFEDLLSDRNHAARILTNVTRDVYKPIAEKDLISDSDGRIFDAACVLYERRLSQEPNRVRSCRAKRPAHRVPALGSLYCRECHNAACFTHLVQWGIHSSKALLATCTADPRGNKGWHQLHIKTRQEFSALKAKAEQEERAGRPVSLDTRLVMAAHRYGCSRPLHEGCVKLGWYDRDMTFEGLVDEDILEPCVDSKSAARLSTSRRGQTAEPNASCEQSPRTATNADSESAEYGLQSPVHGSTTTYDESSSSHGSGAQDTPVSSPDSSPPPSWDAPRKEQSARRNTAYVLIPPMSYPSRRLKRSAPVLADRPLERRRPFPDIQREWDKTYETDDAIAENYGDDLAAVMQAANALILVGPPGRAYLRPRDRSERSNPIKKSFSSIPNTIRDRREQHRPSQKVARHKHSVPVAAINGHSDSRTTNDYMVRAYNTASSASSSASRGTYTQHPKSSSDMASGPSTVQEQGHQNYDLLESWLRESERRNRTLEERLSMANESYTAAEERTKQVKTDLTESLHMLNAKLEESQAQCKNELRRLNDELREKDKEVQAQRARVQELEEENKTLQERLQRSDGIITEQQTVLDGFSGDVKEALVEALIGWCRRAQPGVENVPGMSQGQISQQVGLNNWQELCTLMLPPLQNPRNAAAVGTDAMSYAMPMAGIQPGHTLGPFMQPYQPPQTHPFSGPGIGHQRTYPRPSERGDWNGHAQSPHKGQVGWKGPHEPRSHHTGQTQYRQRGRFGYGVQDRRSGLPQNRAPLNNRNPTCADNGDYPDTRLNSSGMPLAQRVAPFGDTASQRNVQNVNACGPPEWDSALSSRRSFAEAPSLSRASSSLPPVPDTPRSESAFWEDHYEDNEGERSHTKSLPNISNSTDADSRGMIKRALAPQNVHSPVVRNLDWLSEVSQDSAPNHVGSTEERSSPISRGNSSVSF